ncbi:hypothetical protein Tco_0887085 [Tanacetum coccineum]
MRKLVIFTPSHYYLSPCSYTVAAAAALVRFAALHQTKAYVRRRFTHSKHMTWPVKGNVMKMEEGFTQVVCKAWKVFDNNMSELSKRKLEIGLNEESSFMLTLLIPGPKSPGKDIDVYLKPLVEELKNLWKKPGTINDFPARSSLSGWSGQGYFAYPTCNDETPATRVNGKTAYVGHRRFLPMKHRWTKLKTFNGENEYKPALPKLDSAQILRQLSRLPSCISGKHLSHGGTLLMNDKSKETNKARQDLEELGIRNELWLAKKGNGKFLKPHPKYSFTPKKRRKFCEFIKGVKLPDGFGSNFKPKVTDNDNNITCMKSHDCHIMMQRLLPVGAQAYLDSSISTPIIELCSFFKQICARSLCVQTRFNRPNRNEDGGPPPTCELEVFRSVCRPKKNDVCQCLDKIYTTKFSPWFCDKISTLRSKKPSECSLELLALAHGPSNYATSYTSCKVNGVKFLVHIRDKRLTTQCNGVSTPSDKDGTMYDGVDSDSDSKDPDNQRVVTYCSQEKQLLSGSANVLWGFFDIVPWLRGPHGALIEKGTTASFKGLWKGRKSNFKKHEFVLSDGYKEPIKIRDFPPTDVKIDEWQKLYDHFTSEKHLKRSRSSKFNKEANEFPNLIDHFRTKHMKGGKWNHAVAEERYVYNSGTDDGLNNNMVELREAQEGRDTPMTVDEILSEVLGESIGFFTRMR